MKREEYQNLYSKLNDYSESDYYPFHMPGHKRQDYGSGKSAYVYDITEIDGFDNLHAPEEIIKKRLEEVIEFYKSQKSYYMINGSTAGILSAISAVTEYKKNILLARNSHKAAYNAVFLHNLNAAYIYPAYDKEFGISGYISPFEVEKKLIEEDNFKTIGGVFITSPTYEGVVSDIESIAKVVHKYGIPLIVDEAHGAHFGMHKYFPDSALEKGADIVIQSLHKTLPSLTQTAIIHVHKESLIEPEVIERYLGIYQTSSPSYVLMDSIDRCMDLVMYQKEQIFDTYAVMLDDFRRKCKDLSYFKLYERMSGQFDFDKSKVVIVPDKKYYSGKKLYDILLEKYHLQMEMASERYVIAMTSVGDSQKGFDRLYDALMDIERDIRLAARYKMIYPDGNSQQVTEHLNMDHQNPNLSIAQKAIVCEKIKDVFYEKYDIIELALAKGKISKEFIYLYPPGIPILAPGEIITEEIIENVTRYEKMGLNVQGLSDKKYHTIMVVRESWKAMNFRMKNQ